MSEQKIFVGRKDEFKKNLKSSRNVRKLRCAASL